MGEIIPLARFTRASRDRLANRLERPISRVRKEMPQAEYDEVRYVVGHLIHVESGMRYHTAEIPPAMQPAPWLWIIGKLAEEQSQVFGDPGLRTWLRECVEFYLFNLQKVSA